MPWTFDALLDAEHRYSSLKFRRVARQFDPTRMDYGEAVELVGFMKTIDGVKYARWIFGWKAAGVREATRLFEHLDQDEAVANVVAANLAVLERDDGLKCLRAMKDGGWRQGSVPGIVRMAVLDMRDAGMTYREVGDVAGLTRDQVNVIIHGLRRVAAPVPLLGLVAEG